MRKRSLLAFCLLGLAMLLAAPAGALAAKAPKITSVSPMKANVGETLTIKGSGFKPGKGKNTVIFKSGSLYVRIKALSSTRTRMTLKVPAKLAAYMKRRGSKVLATRFQLRVSARGSKFTRSRISPVIGPALPLAGQLPGSGGPTGAAPTSSPAPDGDCDLDGTLNGVDTDDDNDHLTDDQENGFVHPTNPCSADTDGDGVEDGFEYLSAQDLNDAFDDQAPYTPYPSKKPYPNPLFPDANVDYDGDSLTLAEEQVLWIRTGSHALPLNYSDGDLTTQPETVTGSTPGYADMDSNGVLGDDERDADGDGLTNYDELHGRTTYGWWKGVYDKEMDYYVRPFAEVDVFDPDSDGDGVLDGADDQDNDDISNAEEISRSSSSTWVNPWAGHAVNAFNPCLPNPGSRTCMRHPPLTNPPAPFTCAFMTDHPFFPTTPGFITPAFAWAGNGPPNCP